MAENKKRNHERGERGFDGSSAVNVAQIHRTKSLYIRPLSKSYPLLIHATYMKRTNDAGAYRTFARQSTTAVGL